MSGSGLHSTALSPKTQIFLTGNGGAIMLLLRVCSIPETEKDYQCNLPHNHNSTLITLPNQDGIPGSNLLEGPFFSAGTHSI